MVTFSRYVPCNVFNQQTNKSSVHRKGAKIVSVKYSVVRAVNVANHLIKASFYRKFALSIIKISKNYDNEYYIV